MKTRALESAFLHGALVILAVLTLAPLFWMVSASFMRAGESAAVPPPLLPKGFTLEHYITLFTRLDLTRHILNSTIIAVGSAAFSVVLNGMAGYAFAKLRFPGRDRVFQILIIGLVIPLQVGMLPLFLMFKYLGLVNTYWGVIVPSMASILGIFMVRQYALSIPDDLLDAARVDGAGEGEIFRTMVLPMLAPILVTLGAFIFLSAWNDFLWPLVVLSDDRLYTLPVALANLSGEHVQDTELMMAGSVLTTLPVIIVFLFLQRVYIQGVMAGSVKG
jgi:multiple sugar transport system permease protein